MESATYHTASLIDSGAEDYMLETAMLKVFASDALWRIVNDALQIWGGAGYFTDQPFERMMRDARINLIGEGANDVLRSFIAMYGLRGVGKELEQLLKRPWDVRRLWSAGPRVPVNNKLSGALSRQIGQFTRACRWALVRQREGILDRQYVQARIGDTANELFLISCVMARLDALSRQNRTDQRELMTGMLYVKSALRRNRQRLAELRHNDDTDQTQTADAWLAIESERTIR